MMQSKGRWRMERRDYLSAIRAALAGIGAGMILLTLGGLIATRLAHPDRFLTVIGYAALVLGALVCGILQGRSGAPLGGILLAAGIYALLLLGISLAIGGLSRFFTRALIYLGLAIIAGLAARLIPAARPKRRYRY